MADRYTQTVLTTIAMLLVGLLVRDITRAELRFPSVQRVDLAPPAETLKVQIVGLLGAPLRVALTGPVSIAGDLPAVEIKTLPPVFVHGVVYTQVANIEPLRVKIERDVFGR